MIYPMRFVLAGLSLVIAALILPITHWKSPLSLPTPSPTPLPVINLLFTGDAMFDRHVRSNSQTNGYDHIFSNIHALLAEQDIVITNLEGPITDNKSVSQNSIVGSPQNYVFTFDPAILPVLVNNNITLVNLGNNHILNFGTYGLDATTGYLTQHGINYFGNTGQTDVHRYRIINIKGTKFGFVNYNQFVKDGLTAAMSDLQIVRQQVDVMILYAHWGNEYVVTADEAIQILAHQFIDAGADAVIGSHPHVVQQSEIYQGKHIYYSLGNFIFDQYFMPETQQGLLVRLSLGVDRSLTATEYRYSISPTSQIILN